MAFVKLDTTILRSTIWMDRPARELFITSLLLAEVREFEEPVQQISTDSLEFTGWAAPPGWYGYVPASGPGIIHLAQVEFAEGKLALKRLGDPEPESRSQEFEGRRMIRIDGGYLILNYMKHRDKDHSSPLRSARYRERLASRRDATSSHRDDTVAPRDEAVTSHTRVCSLHMPSASGSGSVSVSDPEGVQGEPKRKRAARVPRERWKFVPESWEPKPKHRDKAFEMGWTQDEFARELEKFRNHEFKDTKSDADKTFTTWLLSDIAQQGKGSSVAARGRSGARHPNEDTYDYLFKKATGQ